ncbi:NADH-quinone oxidoreductase subunit C [Haloferula luteola]|uniref:NADH-quinone oxidoreductase subunit C n=1 Tax=Haloferula luteola TaxID=595692 RepID=A0A840V2S5_9BACT|nr:NADH-quinone oxidoreductase subunit C [Haloferula luteola]MBB5352597.1 NADH-quinone oxidoreductase subunit C [Haloferula luteola]
MSTAIEDMEVIRGRWADGVVAVVDFRGEHTIEVKLGVLAEVMAFCRKEAGYEMLLDVASLDHFGEHPRFEMVYELAPVDDSKHLRVRAKVAEEEEVPSVVALWAGAEWHEREVYDMMGIRFTDHPDLRRILMWEGYPFHPLRKDFPLAGRPSEMPDVAFSDKAPLEGGPFVTSAGAKGPVRREPRSREID